MLGVYILLFFIMYCDILKRKENYICVPLRHNSLNKDYEIVNYGRLLENFLNICAILIYERRQRK